MLAGETVNIYDADGNKVGSVVTGEDGSFTFESEAIEEGATYTVVPEASMKQDNNTSNNSSDTSSDKTPKKGNSIWIVVLIIAVLVIGGGLGAWYYVSQKSASKTGVTSEPEKTDTNEWE